MNITHDIIHHVIYLTKTMLNAEVASVKNTYTHIASYSSYLL